MQHRMKEGAMTPAEMEALLREAPVGRISTLGEDG